MSSQLSDRNLLVGVLALQMDLITQPQFIESLQKWMLNKTTPLEDLLLEMKFIQAEAREFLRSLAAQQLKLHSNSVEKSIAALSASSSLQQSLDELNDSDIEATCIRVAEVRKADVATASQAAACRDEETFVLPGQGKRSSRFRILRPHARGGLGQVSVAEDTELNREVALKEIQERFAGDPDSRTRFLIEAEVTGRLEHPGIVPVYSLGQTDSGTPFYAMRFIRGDSLKEAIEAFHSRSGTFGPDQRLLELRKLIQRLIDVCQAIHYAHSRGVLHRDLKPGNIMLGKYGETLVVDWGLAKFVEREKNARHETDEQTVVPSSSDGSTDTRLGTVVGTLAYMSPEQAEGRIDALTPASDVYCLGATLYCILTGRAPVQKSSTEDMLKIIRSGAIPTAIEINSLTPGPLDAVCRKAMSLRAEDRYRTCDAMAEDLELWLADEPVSAWTEPFSTRCYRWFRQHKSLTTAVAGVLLASVAFLAVISTLVRRQNNVMIEKNAEIVGQNETIGKQRDLLAENRDSLATLSVGILTAAETTLGNVANADQFRTSVMEKSFEAFSALSQDQPEDPAVGRAFAEAARLSGNQLGRMSRKPEAIERLRLAIELINKHGFGKDKIAEKDYLAQTHNDLASQLRSIGKLKEAEPEFRLTRQIGEELLAGDPSNTGFRRTLARLLLTYAGFQIDLRQLDAAERDARKASEELVAIADGPEATSVDPVLAMLAIAWHGHALDLQSKPAEARIVFAKGLDWSREYIEQRPNDINILYTYARLLQWDADGAIRANEFNETHETNLDDALTKNVAVSQAMPSTQGFKYNLAMSYQTKGILLRKKKDSEAAFAAFKQAVEKAEEVRKLEPGPNGDDLYASILGDLAETYAQFDQKKLASSTALQAIELAKEAVKQSPENKQYQATLDRVLGLI